MNLSYIMGRAGKLLLPEFDHSDLIEVLSGSILPRIKARLNRNQCNAEESVVGAR